MSVRKAQYIHDSEFSIIIVCEHSAKFLDRALEALSKTESPSTPEIIIIDDGRQTGREQVAKDALNRGQHIRYLDLPDITTAAAWNVGIRESSHGLLAFLDDDCVPPTGWLTAFQDTFAQEWTAGVVGGPDCVPPNSNFFERCLEYVLTSFIGTLGVRSGPNMAGKYYPRPWNMAARKDSVVFAGGFDESSREAPEVAMIKRLEKIGYKAAHQPKAVIGHQRETNLPRFVFRDFRLGLERGRGTSPPGLGRVYGIATGFVLAVLALGMLLHINSIEHHMLPLILGTYGVVLALAGMHAIIRTRSPFAIGLVPIMLVLHHTAHLTGYALGRLTRRRRKW